MVVTLMFLFRSVTGAAVSLRIAVDRRIELVVGFISATR